MSLYVQAKWLGLQNGEVPPLNTDVSDWRVPNTRGTFPTEATTGPAGSCCRLILVAPAPSHGLSICTSEKFAIWLEPTRLVLWAVSQYSEYKFLHAGVVGRASPGVAAANGPPILHIERTACVGSTRHQKEYSGEIYFLQ